MIVFVVVVCLKIFKYLFNQRDVGFQLQKHECITIMSNIDIYIKHPIIMFSCLSFIQFKLPHHPVLQNNLAQSKCTLWRTQEEKGEYNTYDIPCRARNENVSSYKYMCIMYLCKIDIFISSKHLHVFSHVDEPPSHRVATIVEH